MKLFISNCGYIGERAFYNCTELRRAYFNSINIGKIEKQAFAHCINLYDTDIESAAMLEHIGDEAFCACVKLPGINLKKHIWLESIGKSAFEFCTSMEECDLSNCISLRYIGRNAFNGCRNLKKLSLPYRFSDGLSEQQKTGILKMILGDRYGKVNVTYGRDRVLVGEELRENKAGVRKLAAENAAQQQYGARDMK